MAGKVTANTVQLGDSVTATNNFVLKTNADGTATLARGNDGATSQDILTINSDGTLEQLGLPMFQCRAWGSFDGTGTPAYSGSGNMNATITDNGTGDYTVTFSTAMPDANYAINVSATVALVASGSNFARILVYNITATSFSFQTINSAGSSVVDCAFVSFTVFR